MLRRVGANKIHEKDEGKYGTPKNAISRNDLTFECPAGLEEYFGRN
jgi:hypothetical protein